MFHVSSKPRPEIDPKKWLDIYYLDWDCLRVRAGR
jgi:hypothetical protein